MRRLAPLGVLGLLLAALGPALAQVPAPAPRPLTPPPPDVTALIEFAEAPLDKPVITVPDVAMPAPPEHVPPLPLAPPAAPADKLTAPVPPPRTLACAGTWLGIASESLECGLSHYIKNELPEATRALESAVRAGSASDVGRRARYWLGETYWWTGRIDLADSAFRQVVQAGGGDPLVPYALHSSGWTALRLGDLARARETFARVTAPPLDVWGRHGLAVALYALGRPEEATPIWQELATRPLPRALVRDVGFWLGESLGRSGQPAGAVAELGKFVRGGPHPLRETGLLRLGWWALAAGNTAESVTALREAQRLRRPPAASVPDERDWIDAGLALALAGTGDLAGARASARELAARRSVLATPVRVRLVAAGLAARKIPETHATVQELLAGRLEPAARAWALLASGEASRLEGNRDEARTQYQLARDLDRTGATGTFAAFRLGQTNFELREFAQAATDVAGVSAGAIAPELRSAALVLQAEAAYFAGDWAIADRAYRQLLVEGPGAAQAPLVRMSVAWTALRRGQLDEARKHFLEVATTSPAHPSAPDALVLASELALKSGDPSTARPTLDLVINRYGTSPRAPFARLNLGILLARTGHAVAAQRTIGEWLAKKPFPPLVGRGRAALGAAMLANGQDADALREFGVARREGVGALAALGLGASALGLGRADAAVRDLTEARDTGTAPIAAAAEYGLAIVSLQRGNSADFKKAANALLAAAPQGAMAPRLLYVLVGLAVQEKDWPGALATAKRLSAQFKDSDVTDDALERVGMGAARARVWPVASEALALLRQQSPRSPFVESTRLAYAEAEIENGRAEAARRDLEAYVAAAPPAQAGPALALLARARQAAGDRPGALDAYTRAAKAGVTDLPGDAALSHARLLLDEKKWDVARSVAVRAMKSAEPGAAAEAAQIVAQSYQGEGDHLAAAEYFMTAAYVAPQSAAGRQALLGAAQSFNALRQPDAAAIVYRKLLAQSNLPGDLAAAARQGLAAIGRQP